MVMVKVRDRCRVSWSKKDCAPSGVKIASL